MQAQAEEASHPMFYTVEEIRHLVGIGRNRAYKLVTEKDFPSVYIGNRIVIPADLFQAWILKQASGKKGGDVSGKQPTR